MFMKRFLPSIYILLCSISCLAQEQQWGSYFSYYNTIDLAQSASQVFAASESAMFAQNTLTGELKTITSVDGLKADDITTIYHSSTYGRTLVGNSTGLLIIVNNDNSIVTKIDIVQETTVAASKKRINHICEANGVAYISTDYGVSSLNLATLEFIGTYYLGPNGAEIPVLQAAVHNESLYVITSTYGIRRGYLGNPNLNDYNQWEPVFTGTWYNMAEFNGELFITNGGALFRAQDDGNTALLATLPSEIIDLRQSNNRLLATGTNRVVAFNEQFLQEFQINTVGVPATFTCAAIVGGKLYVGTTQKGVFGIDVANYSINNITPNGPLRNRIFSLEKTAASLWAVYGGYGFYFDPDDAQYGASKFTTNEGWLNIPYEELSVLGRIQSISDITINPNNQDEVWLNSHKSGLLKLVGNVPTTFYNTTNSPLQNEQFSNTQSVRVNGGAFDKAGNLWMMNSMTTSPLKVLKAGSSSQWAAYSFVNIATEANLKQENYGKIVIDNNNTKWIPTTDNGVIAFNDELSNKLIKITDDNGMPSNYAKCVAIDNNNRLWIGTTNGLRIISSVQRFVTEDMLTATNIVILEDGLAQELMYEQTISDIKVDGANNKWIATTAGAFLVSPDGQNTLFHFTRQNSPLPSNNIIDIEIDNTTGEVFFATEKGMVSYKGTSTAASDNLSNVYVFPNPVRPGYQGDVNISGLIDNANIKITDIEGNLVYETTSEGGTVLWDTRAFGKHKVASGVYMIFISAEDGVETKVKKVMIVR
jgi:ligand-binding sensor domain-containing protein